MRLRTSRLFALSVAGIAQVTMRAGQLSAYCLAACCSAAGEAPPPTG